MNPFHDKTVGIVDGRRYVGDQSRQSSSLSLKDLTGLKELLLREASETREKEDTKATISQHHHTKGKQEKREGDVFSVTTEDYRRSLLQNLNMMLRDQGKSAALLDMLEKKWFEEKMAPRRRKREEMDIDRGNNTGGMARGTSTASSSSTGHHIDQNSDHHHTAAPGSEEQGSPQTASSTAGSYAIGALRPLQLNQLEEASAGTKADTPSNQHVSGQSDQYTDLETPRSWVTAASAMASLPQTKEELDRMSAAEIEEFIKEAEKLQQQVDTARRLASERLKTFEPSRLHRVFKSSLHELSGNASVMMIMGPAKAGSVLKEMQTKELRVPLYDIETSVGPKVFCVTGANGYIGSEIVRRLLLAGHTVQGTVRGDPDSSRFDGLKNLPHADQRLKIFTADLSAPGSFDRAVAGCHVVIHVASPVTVQVSKNKAEQEVVVPAVRGVEHVVSAIEKSGTVGTLVYTSSMSAVFGDNWERGEGHTFTEEDWDEVASVRRFPYAYSKTLAEKKAWELYHNQEERVKGRTWRLVTILPAFVVGPPAIKVDSELVQFAVLLMKGKIWPIIPNYHFPFVDLADVAAAHVLVALDQRASGRYMLGYQNQSVGFATMIQSIRHPQFSKYRFPIMQAPKWVLWILSKVTPTVTWELVEMCLNKPMSFLGDRISQDTDFVYHDPKKGLIDLLQRILDLGMAPKR